MKAIVGLEGADTRANNSGRPGTGWLAVRMNLSAVYSHCDILGLACATCPPHVGSWREKFTGAFAGGLNGSDKGLSCGREDGWLTVDEIRQSTG